MWLCFTSKMCAFRRVDAGDTDANSLTDQFRRWAQQIQAVQQRQPRRRMKQSKVVTITDGRDDTVNALSALVLAITVEEARRDVRRRAVSTKISTMRSDGEECEQGGRG